MHKSPGVPRFKQTLGLKKCVLRAAQHGEFNFPLFGFLPEGPEIPAAIGRFNRGTALRMLSFIAFRAALITRGVPGILRIPNTIDSRILRFINFSHCIENTVL